MEQYAKLKKIVEPSGNAGHVYLPKQLIGKEVTILVPKKFDLSTIFSALSGDMDRVMGIYLVGSHARGEGKTDSDVDLLIVCHGECRIECKSDQIDIFMLSYENKILSLFAKSMLQEAEPLMNSKLLEELKKRKFTYKKELEIGRSALRIAKNLLKLSEDDEEIDPGMVYSLVLRLKTYLTYRCIREKKKYSTKLLLEELSRHTNKPEQMLDIYRAERENVSLDVKIKKKDVKKLLEELLKMYR